MQAFMWTARCTRFVLMFGMMAVMGSAVLGQTGKTPGSPPAAIGPAIVPPEASATIGPAIVPPEAPAATQAATTAANTAPAAETSLQSPSAGWMEVASPVIRTVGGVGLVLNLIVAGFILMRRFGPRYMRKQTQERCLRLLETLPMGEKRSLVLVQAGTRKLLLASTAGQITLLTSRVEVAGPAALHEGDATDMDALAAPPGNFRTLYEMEKKAATVRPVRPTLPPDIRGKMQELRKALEG
jgi:flagellar biogenesis protein FliO